MRNFNYSKIKDKKWDSEILSLVASIYKYQGKQELYLKQRPEELNKLIEIAKIQSTEASNEIEGIVTTSARLKKLVEEKTTPRNRNEQEIAGYRDVLNIIHENFDVISISKNYILQMHKIMFKYMDNPLAGKTKNIQNYITINYSNGESEILFTPLSPFETPEALENICNEYNKVIGNFNIDPLIAIPIFIHDFLCIHPFNDGNGRMSRLLTTLLLYRQGYVIGKYISLESKIEQNKDGYYSSLRKSGLNWYEGQEDVTPFIKYILRTILAAYIDFEERVDYVDEKLPSIELVRKAVNKKLGKFTKSDIMELVPSIGKATVENMLKKLVEEGYINRYGKGRSTYYVKNN